MSAPVSSEEQEQILQTIEMFEVITQANPQDCQSLEILKEAYWKIGRQRDSIAVTRKLADTYMNLGQYSSALLEYEGILEREPDSPGVLAMRGEVEAKLGSPGPRSQNGIASGIDVDFGSVARNDPTLIRTAATHTVEPGRTELNLSADGGNEALARFLIQNRLAPEDVVNSSLERVLKINRTLSGKVLAASLLHEISNDKLVDLEALLCGVLDRTKFAFVPLDIYDVDRAIVKMLPESLTLGRLIVPFDLISRTIMVAVANPLDASGKEATQQLLDYNIQWHLAAPAPLFRALRETYRLAPPSP